MNLHRQFDFLRYSDFTELINDSIVVLLPYFCTVRFIRFENLFCDHCSFSIVFLHKHLKILLWVGNLSNVKIVFCLHSFCWEYWFSANNERLEYHTLDLFRLNAGSNSYESIKLKYLWIFCILLCLNYSSTTLRATFTEYEVRNSWYAQFQSIFEGFSFLEYKHEILMKSTDILLIEINEIILIGNV